MSLVAEKPSCLSERPSTANDEQLVTFFHAYPDALPPMRADKAALGGIPVKAYQYCEALRIASGFGWYAFPAADIQLCFDGVDVFWADDGQWEKLSIEYLPSPEEWWAPHCPDYLSDMAPPFISSLGVPGFVQIWTGLLVRTRKDWSVHVRPLANSPSSNQYFCFEGIVETDKYAPMPLFINLKLQKTDTIISFDRNQPLFQIQPLHRSHYATDTLSQFEVLPISHKHECGNQQQTSMTDLDWEGYSKTVRVADPEENAHQSGSYAKECRKRSKSTD